MFIHLVSLTSVPNRNNVNSYHAIPKPADNTIVTNAITPPRQIASKPLTHITRVNTTSNMRVHPVKNTPLSLPIQLLQIIKRTLGILDAPRHNPNSSRNWSDV